MLQRAVKGVTRGPRKRSLPIGVRHVRKQVTLSPAHIKRLKQRVAAARAAKVDTSFSGEIARCVDEADGNLRSMRHALRQPLNHLRMQVAILRQKVAAGEPVDLEDLDPLDAEVKHVSDRLEPPAANASSRG